MSYNSRRSNTLPHKEIAGALSVAAIGYCMYSLWNLFITQRCEQLQKKLDEIDQEQEQRTNPHSQIQTLRGLTFDIPYHGEYIQHDGSEGYDSPFFCENEAVAADLPDTAPLSPLHRPSSRMSIASQPASPQTHSVINKLDSLNGFRLWTKLDPTGTGRVSKQSVLEHLQQMGDLLIFVGSTISDSTDQPRNVLERAVDKIAGANNEYVTKQRWEKYLKDGRIDLHHIDNVD